MALAALCPLETSGRWFRRHITSCATEDLKIEDFKPEFAGKMNFYLSAIDDLLRHSDDAATIGIVLCKGRNAVVVEYALRDTAKPMGVAQYMLTHALPDTLRRELPTIEDLSREFPLIALVSLRMELERELVRLASGPGVADTDAPLGIAMLTARLVQSGILPREVADQLQAISFPLNAAVHGRELTASDAKTAIADGADLLRRLKEI